ncbi:hypothetical protein [Nocardia testacea]|uniref:hypothetical protein n=1 Tax=Nocardia testacea TaxID=248551 RepID=UPI0033C1D309
MSSSRELELEAEARRDLLELIETEHAVVWSEVEAKLTREVLGNKGEIYPHHLTTAKQQLIEEGILDSTKTMTRGGHEIETFSFTQVTGRGTRINRAAARKRLLMSRYRGWASGTVTYPSGLIGPAGEATVRRAIMDAGTLAVSSPGAGEVSKVLGTSLTGSLDSGGWLPAIDSRGLPEGLVYVPIEIKNIRDWIYPTSAELYQLLHKSALLQQGAPDTNIMPVLVTRRVNHTLRFLATRLGFKVLDLQQQYVRSVVDDEDLAEIRAELDFLDLMKPDDRPSLKTLDKFFQTSMASKALEYADLWKETVLDHNLDDYFRQLRKQNLRRDDRTAVMNEFRRATERVGMRGGW